MIDGGGRLMPYRDLSHQNSCRSPRGASQGLDREIADCNMIPFWVVFVMWLCFTCVSWIPYLCCNCIVFVLLPGWVEKLQRALTPLGTPKDARWQLSVMKGSTLLLRLDRWGIHSQPTNTQSAKQPTTNQTTNNKTTTNNQPANQPVEQQPAYQPPTNSCCCCCRCCSCKCCLAQQWF